ncbi:hypothetical protein [Sporomusa sp.]|nr:hypothetical protein [Sporomusa sp.]HWR43239.1 hypothetical protein [Sporomusa sp.]
MTDKSDVLTSPKNTMPRQERNNKEKAKNLTTKEIEAGPPAVGDDAWLPS